TRPSVSGSGQTAGSSSPRAGQARGSPTTTARTTATPSRQKVMPLLSSRARRQKAPRPSKKPTLPGHPRTHLAQLHSFTLSNNSHGVTLNILNGTGGQRAPTSDGVLNTPRQVADLPHAEQCDKFPGRRAVFIFRSRVYSLIDTPRGGRAGLSRCGRPLLSYRARIGSWACSLC